MNMIDGSSRTPSMTCKDVSNKKVPYMEEFPDLLQQYI